jgi:mono/diheme cytochrome c family protein
MTRRLPLAILGLLLLAPLARAQNDVDPTAEKPVAVWKFDAPGEPGVPKASAKFLEPGPRPPSYPAFAATNIAMTFTAANASVTVRESDLPKANLRFGLNDSITLEAWVKVAELKDGNFAYVVGKGRNRRPGFPELNQNYALRLKGEKGEVRLSFLFASEPAGGKAAEWHRWTTSKGFTSGGWHHVAVAYTFGKPESVRGYIDGVAVKGTWDMGGATTRAPVQDADDLTIGTGNGGGAGNSFRGVLDEVTIWRTALSDDLLKNRYQFVPPPPVVKRADLPKGEVLVQLCEEGLPNRNAWPDVPPKPTESYREDCFGFFEVPHKYVDTGVRGDRANPYLFRAAALVSLPPGKHRVLLRGRGTARLYFDEKLLLSTPFPPTDSSGHGTVRAPESYLNLGPDFRFAPPGNREGWAHLESKGGEHLVVLETIVGNYIGNNRRRPELGETVVAISFAGSESWQLLSPGKRVVPYTDAGWTAYEAERSAHLDRVNAAAREAKRKEHDAYWVKRREAAQQWLKSTPDEKVPELPKGFPAHNPIDHFLAAKVVQVKRQGAAPAGAVDFYRQVQPILEAKCYGCHTGGKAKGGLRLDDLASVLKGGKNDGPAVTPGKPGSSALLARVKATDDTAMPPKGEKLTAEEIRVLEAWVKEGARWPDLDAEHFTLTPLADDLAFLRRVTLDTVGVVPTTEEIRAFLADRSPDRRAKVIDRLLADPRWADHWMGYWLDVLAENPNIINPTLNNTGPFRWWLYESFRDNKPMDLFVTELLRMRGSARFGGPAGFGVASQNDVPMAMKGTVVAAAFLGVEMKCARCHDAPAHASTQRELFQLAAMMGTKPIKVPATSSVPLDKVHEGGRKPLISVTLKPGTDVEAEWPFAQLAPEELGKQLAEYANDPRDRLAALVTAPRNERFAQVMANRVWARLMGRGLVEPAEDWERGRPSHPELLRWLGREFVRGGYDVKHLSRLIFNSHAYQRAADPVLKDTPVLFTAPARRRLTAEQIVDSMFAATGAPFRLEEVSLDVDGIRDMNSSITLGKPRRSWMLTSTSNERDRPSLSLPRIQMVVDVLQAFGWRASRQDPLTTRETATNVLQPAILQNGPVGLWLTRLSDQHGVTELAVSAKSVDELLDELFLRVLTRKPTEKEREAYGDYLRAGFDSRVKTPPTKPAVPRVPEPYVSWSNHLHTEANSIMIRRGEAARRGDPPTQRLDADWRARLEDVLWAVLNSSEFVFTP